MSWTDTDETLEYGLLGTCLLDAGNLELATERLQPDDFAMPDARVIFEFLQAEQQAGRFPGYLEVEVHMTARRISREPLRMMMRHTTGNVSALVAVLLDSSARRRMRALAFEIAQHMGDNVGDPWDEIARVQAELASIQSRVRAGVTYSVAELMPEAAEMMTRQANGEITGIPSGLKLDRMTGGWQPGELVIIAGRPSMGKSVLGFQACVYPAVTQGIKTGFLSLEMDRRSVATRLLISQAELSAYKTKQGLLSANEQDRARQVAMELSDPMRLPIYINDTAGLTVNEVRSAIKSWVRDGVRLVVVDYLQLVRPEQIRNGTREQEVAQVSSMLKQVARETGIPIIALAQVKRPENSKSAPRPQLQDLRESGSIEQDADVVVMVHRPEYYGAKTTEEGNPTAGLAELIVAKARNGPTGIVEHFWNRDRMRFEDATTFKTITATAKDEEPF